MAQSTPALETDDRAEAGAPGALLDRTRLLAAAPFAPALVALAIWVVWMSQSGGYFPRDWYPGAIVLTLTLAMVAVARRELLPPSTAARAALALFAFFVAWAYLSLAWAGSPGSALEAANQLLLYLLGAWTLSLVPWRRRPALAFIVAWSLAVALLCAIALVGGLVSSQLGHYIADARWVVPTRYPNATAALASMAFWPAVLLASRRRASALVQVLALCLAVFLVEFSLLPQSRGSAIAMVGVALVVIALWPARPRLLLRLAVVAGAVAITVGPISDVFTAAEHRRPVGPVLEHAAELMLVSLGLTALAGVALVVAERRVRPSELARRRARLGLAGVAVLAALAGATLIAVNGGRIERSLSHRWKTFTSSTRSSNTAGPRLAASDAHARHEMWRVALDTFAGSPLHGAGAGNFDRVYTAQRRVVEPSRYAHSIWMRFLAEAGAVGTAAFVGLVAVLLAGLIRGGRGLEEDGRALVVGCVAVTVYFLLHSSVDWLDVMPAVAAPAFAFPFVGLRAVASVRRGSPAQARAALLRRRAAVALAAALALAALVALSLPYLAVRYTDRGKLRGATESAAAYGDFDTAAALNALSPQPYLAAGTLAVGRGQDAVARRAFGRALALEDGWFPHFELALLDERGRRVASARAEIARAARLNPHDPLVLNARRLIGRGAPIDPAAVNRSALRRRVDNTGPIK